MISWIKTDEGLEALMLGRKYLITKGAARYIVSCDNVLVGAQYSTLDDAKDAAEAHAAFSTYPAPLADGVHIDAIAGLKLINIIKQSFTVDEINKMMEASPYDEPDTGAPESPL